MKIAVFGLGWVGTVTAVSLASDGHQVWGVDSDPMKLHWIESGAAPIREPGLPQRLADVLRSHRLRVTSDARKAVEDTDVAMVCVGTPSGDSGATDLSSVLHVVTEIGQTLRDISKPYTVILRSTVPVGSTRDLVLPALEEASDLTVGNGLDLFFNPEFLREGSAFEDFHRPPFTIVGSPLGTECAGIDVVRRLYSHVNAPFLVLNYQEAELLKLTCNGFHALKVAFANEIGSLAGHLDADPVQVMRAFVLDTRLNISDAYLTPGFPFGGSCLPKDLRALTWTALEHGVELPLCQSILPSNDYLLDRIASAVIEGDYGTIGVIGLVFKAGTDDVRESPALRLVNTLLSTGRNVVIHEPEISLERLTGANLTYLTEMLTDYADRLVSWETLKEMSDVFLVTRPGVISVEALSAGGVPVLDSTRHWEWETRLEALLYR